MPVIVSLLEVESHSRTDGSSYNILSSNLPNSISRRGASGLTYPVVLLVPAADNLNEPKLTPPLEYGSINTLSICYVEQAGRE